MATSKPYPGQALGVKKPLAGYLRLTIDRDGRKIGYDVQMDHITRGAALRGETIGEWYRDEDVTAADRKVKREHYERMLTDIDAGLWGGIAVWRLDRLVRLSYEFERCYRIVEENDGAILAFDPQPISSGEEIGRLFMRIMVMMAEMEIAGMKARAKGHRRARARAGMAHGGGPRKFGFVGAIKDEEGHYLNVGRVGVDHNVAEIGYMREAGRRLTQEGWLWTDVLKDWHARGIVGTTGAPIGMHTLQTIMTSLRAAGKVEYEDEDPETGEIHMRTRAATWEPPLDEETWKKLRSMIKRRGKPGRRSEYALSGIALCGGCGLPLGGRRRMIYKNGEYQGDTFTYYCKSDRNEKEKGRCGKLEVRQENVDAMVKHVIIERLRRMPTLIQDLREGPVIESNELDIALAEIEEVDATMEQMAQDFGSKKGAVYKAFLTAMTELEERKAAAENILTRAAERSTVPTPRGSDFDDLETWYMGLALTPQKKLITTLIESIVIRPGYSGNKFDPNRVELTPRASRSAKKAKAGR